MNGENFESPPVSAIPPEAPPPLPPPTPSDPQAGSASARNLKKDLELTHVIYGLMAAGYVTGGLGNIAAIILNYIKRDDVKGTWLESHFSWQIRTFWWTLLWGLLSMVLMFVLIGFFTIFVLMIWHIYRIAKGWIKLNDGKAIEG